MIAFAALAAVCVVAALVIVLRPLLGRRARSPVSREIANRDIYRDQFAELERDLASGLLSSGQYGKARGELERRMLDDLSGPIANTTSGSGRGIVVATGVAIPVLATALYLHLGNPDGIGVQPHAATEASSVSSRQFEAMTAELAQRLQVQPNDAEGWMMLGRAYRAMDKPAEAAAAYRKAVALDPRNVSLLADLAEAVASSQNRSLQGEPAKMLARARPGSPGPESAGTFRQRGL